MGSHTLATILETVERGKLDLLIAELQRIQRLATPTLLRTPRRLPAVTQEELVQWEAFFAAWYRLFGARWVETAHLLTRMISEQTTPTVDGDVSLLHVLPASLQNLLEEPPLSRCAAGKGAG